MDERRIYYSKFAVGEKPYCAWEWNRPERNLEYLERVDPTSFDYVGRVNAKKLGIDDGQRATSTSASKASEGLVATATEADAALIALGSARHGPLGRFTVGSITNEMLHVSPFPMALAPRGYRPSSDARLGRVTCAFSGSMQSRSAFDAAVQLSRRHAVPLRLTTFVVHDRQMYPSQVGYDAERLVEGQWREQALEAQEKALATLPEDVAVESGVVSGRDWEETLDSLPWEEGEVLVVGSSRLGSVARVFLGSNSTKIIRSSPVPVLVIPRGTDMHLQDSGSIPRVEWSRQRASPEF